MAWLIACSLGIILLSIARLQLAVDIVFSGTCLQGMSTDIRYFRFTDMWLMWWKTSSQKEPEILRSILFLSDFETLRSSSHDLFPDEKKQTRWKFCGGVGWGAICEGLKETNVTRSTDLSMASGYCMSKELRNCLTFQTPKTFWKETSIHPKLVWKKTLGEASRLCTKATRDPCVALRETANGSTVPFTQRVQDPVFAKFTRFHALNKNHVPGLGF